MTRQNGKNTTIRRKKCQGCGHGWYTVEVPLPPYALLHTKDATGTSGFAIKPEYKRLSFGPA
jgi:hypothetical protein